MANINIESSKPLKLNIPTDYPMDPFPNRISLLFVENKTNLYHKNSVLYKINTTYRSYVYPDDTVEQYGEKPKLENDVPVYQKNSTGQLTSKTSFDTIDDLKLKLKSTDTNVYKRFLNSFKFGLARNDEQVYDLMVTFYNKKDGVFKNEWFLQRYYNSVNGASSIYTDIYGYDIDAQEEGSHLRGVYETNEFKTDADKLINQRNTYFDQNAWKIVDGKSVIERGFDLYSENGTIVTSRKLVEKSDYISRYSEVGGIPTYNTFNNYNAVRLNTPTNRYNTKFNDKSEIVSSINDNLKKVINRINYSDNYMVADFSNKDTHVFSSGEFSKQGYDRLYDIAKTPFNMKNSPDSVESAYYNKNIRTLHKSINANKNYGFSETGRADTINTITILKDDRKIKDQYVSGYTEWKPYEDDLIAFFFYDVVNGRYIPFRAIIKNLTETNNAAWEAQKFIGRADSLYSYTGFTRNLSFGFNVVASSLVELFPIWKRISYIASAVKPSGYTKKQYGEITDRFITPPMFMITIGDLYKYQPVVINNVTVSIPDGALWETMPENSTEDWSYLAGIITTKVPKERIAQLPREIEVTVTCDILEKERPEVGGNHYGHAPLDDIGAELWDANSVYLPKPSSFSRNLRINSEELNARNTMVENTNLE